MKASNGRPASPGLGEARRKKEETSQEYFSKSNALFAPDVVTSSAFTTTGRRAGEFTRRKGRTATTPVRKFPDKEFTALILDTGTFVVVTVNIIPNEILLENKLRR
jgi:hypothetical protein